MNKLTLNFDTMNFRCDISRTHLCESDMDLQCEYTKGVSSLLTELTPNKRSTHCDKVIRLSDMAVSRVFDYTKHQLRYSAQRSLPLTDCYPYAVTFTFNRENMAHIDEYGQWDIFCHAFDKWKSLFLKRMTALASNRYFIAYEVYPEFTEAGTLHAHGLIYYSSNYYQAVGKIMAKAWVDKTKQYGTKMSAQRKKNAKGGYDNAFDGCSNVASWRKYITKCHPQHSMHSCLTIVDDTLTIEDE